VVVRRQVEQQDGEAAAMWHARIVTRATDSPDEVREVVATGADSHERG
jgi:hypothetical protein